MPTKGEEPRREVASHVDHWCSRCGRLTKPEQRRVMVRVDDDHIRFDHEGDECPAERAEAYNSAARTVVQGRS